MICRDRTTPSKEMSRSQTVDLENVDTPLLLSHNDVHRGKNLARKWDNSPRYLWILAQWERFLIYLIINY